MRQACEYVASESTRRLVELGMSTGLTNTHTARRFSVLHHCLLENIAFPVLHCVIKVSLHYFMLHRFEVHSALELSRTALLGCSLAINKKLKEHLNLVGLRGALQCPSSASYNVVSRILSYSSLGGTSEKGSEITGQALHTFCLISICLLLSDDANERKSITISVTSENLCPIYRNAPENFSLKNSKLYKECMGSFTFCHPAILQFLIAAISFLIK